MGQAFLPPPNSAEILTGVWIRAELLEKKPKTRERLIARMDKLMDGLVGSPARVVRVVEPSRVFDDERLVAVAIWKAVRMTVESETGEREAG